MGLSIYLSKDDESYQMNKTCSLCRRWNSNIIWRNKVLVERRTKMLSKYQQSAQYGPCARISDLRFLKTTSLADGEGNHTLRSITTGDFSIAFCKSTTFFAEGLSPPGEL